MNAMSKIEPAPPLVYAAMAKVMADLGAEGISKSRKNAQQGYNFRGIDEVYNALSPVLAKHRLLMLPRVMSRHQDERTTKSGGALFYTVVEVEFDLVCADDGSQHTIRTVGEAMDSADKSTNKAQSAAFKYAAMQAFCIPTEGDNDADHTTHDVAPRRPTREAATKAAGPPEDFSPAMAAIDVEKALRAAADKAALDSAWRDCRDRRSYIKDSEPDLHERLVATFAKVADGFRRKPQADDTLDDEVPY